MASDAKRILLVEDEKVIRDAVQAYLEREGYWVRSVGDGQSAVEEFEKHTFDLIILDLMLPKLSGERVCRAIRDTSDVPIIMLTAKGEVEDRIIGLELGADDYLIKPFSPRELVARIRARLRRSEGSSHGLRVGPLALDPVAHRASLLDVPLNLTPTEFRLLQELMAADGDPVPVGDLFRRVWDAEPDASSRNTVMVHIRRLRAKLERVDASRGYVQTVWGVGYRVSGDGR